MLFFFLYGILSWNIKKTEYWKQKKTFYSRTSGFIKRIAKCYKPLCKTDVFWVSSTQSEVSWKRCGTTALTGKKKSNLFFLLKTEKRSCGGNSFFCLLGTTKSYLHHSMWRALGELTYQRTCRMRLVAKEMVNLDLSVVLKSSKSKIFILSSNSKTDSSF